MKTEIRYANRGDFDAFLPDPLPCRVRGFALELDGTVIAVGGLAFLPNGMVGTFMHQRDGARRYKVALHKAGLRLVREIQELGIKRVVASADPAIDASARWLERLGFVPTGAASDGHRMFVFKQ